MLVLAAGVGFTTATLGVAARPAGAAVCRDLALNQPSPAWYPGVSQPPSCTDWAKYTFFCFAYNEKASAYVGGSIRSLIRLDYAGGPLCRMVWAQTQGGAWNGIFFTRTTWTGDRLHFYEDTLGLPLFGSGWQRTEELRDNGRYGFACGYDGRNWICTNEY